VNSLHVIGFFRKALEYQHNHAVHRYFADACTNRKNNVCEVAKTTEEVEALVKAGFTRESGLEGAKLFKKPKLWLICP